MDASRAVMHPVTEAIRPLNSPKIWDDISPNFLTTFWYDFLTLTLVREMYHVIHLQGH